MDVIIIVSTGLGDLEEKQENVIERIQQNILNGSIIVENPDSNLFKDGVITIDNDTLPIFQDFVIVLEDGNLLTNLTEQADVTLQNILNNMKTEQNGFNLIFDPDSLVFGLTDEISQEEAAILNAIKEEINSAVGMVAEDCGGRLCIQSISGNNTTINAVNITHLLNNPTTDSPDIPEPSNNDPSGVVIIEPKNKVQAKLSFCLSAIQCIDPVSCMFAQSKCLQLSNIDILPEKLRKDMAECKVESLLCSLQVAAPSSQKVCEAMFSECTIKLGVDLVGDTVVNFFEAIKDIDNGSTTSTVDEVFDSSVTTDNPALIDSNDGKDQNGVDKNLISSSISPLSDELVENSNQVTKTDDIHNESVVKEQGAANLPNDDADTKNPSKPELSEISPEVLNISKPSDFELNLPNLGFKVTVNKEKPDVANKSAFNSTEFSIAFPGFGFNITLDKNTTHCKVGNDLYEDFELIPSSNQCEICQCVVGKVECYKKACTPDSQYANCKPILEPGSCCPTYDCNDNIGSNPGTLDNKDVEKSVTQLTDAVSSPDVSDLARQGDVTVEIDEAKEILNSVKTALMDIFTNTTSSFQGINLPVGKDNQSDSDDSSKNLDSTDRQIIGFDIVTEQNTEKGVTRIPDTEGTEVREGITESNSSSDVELNTQSDKRVVFEEISLPSFDIQTIKSVIESASTTGENSIQIETTTRIFNEIKLDFADGELENSGISKTKNSTDFNKAVSVAKNPGVFGGQPLVVLKDPSIADDQIDNEDKLTNINDVTIQQQSEDQNNQLENQKSNSNHEFPFLSGE